METKICKSCGLKKPFCEFSKQKNGKFGLKTNCNICHRKLNKDYYLANKEKVSERNSVWQKNDINKEAIRFYYVKRTYGIDKDKWLEMLALQENCCAICDTFSEKIKFFSTDHDHVTGKVRGLLCKNCNTLLGHAKDDVEILKKAIIYLKNNL